MIFACFLTIKLLRTWRQYKLWMKVLFLQFFYEYHFKKNIGLKVHKAHLIKHSANEAIVGSAKLYGGRIEHHDDMWIDPHAFICYSGDFLKGLTGLYIWLNNCSACYIAKVGRMKHRQEKKERSRKTVLA